MIGETLSLINTNEEGKMTTTKYISSRYSRNLKCDRHGLSANLFILFRNKRLITMMFCD